MSQIMELLFIIKKRMRNGMAVQTGKDYKIISNGLTITINHHYSDLNNSHNRSLFFNEILKIKTENK